MFFLVDKSLLLCLVIEIVRMRYVLQTTNSVNLEKKCLSSLELPLIYYGRYVDIFCIVHSSHIGNLIDTFNDYHHNIQCTLELEHNHTLNFLDVTLTKEFVWYRKPTFSDLILKYFFNHPNNQHLTW